MIESSRGGKNGKLNERIEVSALWSTWATTICYNPYPLGCPLLLEVLTLTHQGLTNMGHQGMLYLNYPT